LGEELHEGAAQLVEGGRTVGHFRSRLVAGASSGPFFERRFAGFHRIAALGHGGANVRVPTVDDPGRRVARRDPAEAAHDRPRRPDTKGESDIQPHDALDHDAELRRFGGRCERGAGASPSRRRCAARETPVPKAIALTTGVAIARLASPNLCADVTSRSTRSISVAASSTDARASSSTASASRSRTVRVALRSRIVRVSATRTAASATIKIVTTVAPTTARTSLVDICALPRHVDRVLSASLAPILDQSRLGAVTG